MKNNLVGLIVGVTISIILIGSVLVPSLNDATATHETIENVGQYYMTDDDDTYTMVYNPTEMTLTVNGESESITSKFGGNTWTLASTDNFIVRINGYAAQNYPIWYIANGSARVLANANNTADTTITFNDGTMTVGNESYTYTSDSFRGYVSEKDEYVMTNGTDLPILNKDTSIIVGNGTTLVDVWTDRFYITGTVEDGVTVSTLESITVSDVELNVTKLSKYVDGYEFTSVTFTATGSGDPVDATYNRVIVPTEVTVEYANHMTDAQISLVAVIPVIAIVGVLLAAVYAISWRD